MGGAENNPARSLIILAGAVVGFLQGLRLLSPSDQNRPIAADIDRRLDALEIRIDEVTSHAARVEVRLDSSLSRDDLREAVDRAVGDTWVRIREIEEKMEERFVCQDRASEALRSLISETDRMLERVVEGLDLLAESRENAAR